MCTHTNNCKYIRTLYKYDMYVCKYNNNNNNNNNDRNDHNNNNNKNNKNNIVCIYIYTYAPRNLKTSDSAKRRPSQRAGSEARQMGIEPKKRRRPGDGASGGLDIME